MFASPHKRGTQPYWPGSLFRAHLQPALEAAGHPRQRRLAHAAAHLRNAHEGDGEDIKPIQELLRHANYKVPPTCTRGDDQGEARGANRSRENNSAGKGHQEGGLNREFLPYSNPFRTLGRKGQSQ